MLNGSSDLEIVFQSFYSDKFGKDNLIIIKDSKNVEVNKLNADKAYIQVTYVEPFFDTYELRERVTVYERNFNIGEFRLWETGFYITLKLRIKTNIKTK